MSPFVLRPFSPHSGPPTLSHKALAVGVFQMIEDVLGDGPVSASRFSQWFSSNLSPSGSRSSSLRSTPHEELERLAGKNVLVSTAGSKHFVPYYVMGCSVNTLSYVYANVLILTMHFNVRETLATCRPLMCKLVL